MVLIKDYVRRANFNTKPRLCSHLHPPAPPLPSFCITMYKMLGAGGKQGALGSM